MSRRMSLNLRTINKTFSMRLISILFFNYFSNCDVFSLTKLREVLHRTSSLDRDLIVRLSGWFYFRLFLRFWVGVVR